MGTIRKVFAWNWGLLFALSACLLFWGAAVAVLMR